MSGGAWLVPLAEFQQGLAGASEDFFTGLRHGSMRALIYAPDGVDDQTPHTQDELYIVISGVGLFRKGDEIRRVGPGDMIFVEAQAEHRFENFSADFVTWAVFWGPDGGE